MSTAQAGPMHLDDAWFTLEGTTCTDAQVLFQGPQQTLTINNNSHTPCNMTVGYNVIADGPRRMTFYSFQLRNTPDISLISVDQTPGDALGMATHFAFNTAGYFFDVGGANQFGIGNAGGLVARFTIRINNPDSSPHLFLGDYGTSAQGYSTGELWYGRVGPNAPSYGDGLYSHWGPLPVISITNVPEPGTLGLLVASFILLGRRNRSA